MTSNLERTQKRSIPANQNRLPRLDEDYEPLPYGSFGHAGAHAQAQPGEGLPSGVRQVADGDVLTRLPTNTLLRLRSEQAEKLSATAKHTSSSILPKLKKI